MLLVHLYVYFARVNFCHFSLPLGAACDCDVLFALCISVFCPSAKFFVVHNTTLPCQGLEMITFIIYNP